MEDSTEKNSMQDFIRIFSYRILYNGILRNGDSMQSLHKDPLQQKSLDIRKKLGTYAVKCVVWLRVLISRLFEPEKRPDDRGFSAIENPSIFREIFREARKDLVWWEEGFSICRRLHIYTNHIHKFRITRTTLPDFPFVSPFKKISSSKFCITRTYFPVPSCSSCAEFTVFSKSAALEVNS